ncbi:MAG: glycoside hydrolase family 99-like domain-containing protein, partial [Rickettsiales bacterium]|nr:glycoside hydrolase family 99-like domain-containing protein [Rickettsiales bacterium]
MARASAKKKAIATAPKAVVKIEDKQSSRPLANVQEDPFLIAFYLPQYHPIPENDKWWGKGFTEWSNVAKGQPQFEGHYQPHVPSDLGFYDLRMGEIQKEQARLAKAHGVDAFCYYYYWFSGKKLLEKPLENMLASDSDFPFCICWANENWTRRWDGMDDDILIEQKYRKEDPELFAKEVAPILKDERYIRVQGKPLFIVYKATDIPNLQDTLKLWRKVWQNEGIDEVQICAVMTQPEHDLTSF